MVNRVLKVLKSNCIRALIASSHIALVFAAAVLALPDTARAQAATPAIPSVPATPAAPFRPEVQGADARAETPPWQLQNQRGAAGPAATSDADIETPRRDSLAASRRRALPDVGPPSRGRAYHVKPLIDLEAIRTR